MAKPAVYSPRWVVRLSDLGLLQWVHLQWFPTFCPLRLDENSTNTSAVAITVALRVGPLLSWLMLTYKPAGRRRGQETGNDNQANCERERQDVDLVTSWCLLRCSSGNCNTQILSLSSTEPIIIRSHDVSTTWWMNHTGGYIDEYRVRELPEVHVVKGLEGKI